MAAILDRTSVLLKENAAHRPECTMAKQAGLKTLASHRLNIIAAIFFPILAFTSIFIMNPKYGFAQEVHWPFWLFVVIGIVIGIARIN